METLMPGDANMHVYLFVAPNAEQATRTLCAVVP